MAVWLFREQGTMAGVWRLSSFSVPDLCSSTQVTAAPAPMLRCWGARAANTQYLVHSLS